MHITITSEYAIFHSFIWMANEMQREDVLSHQTQLLPGLSFWKTLGQTCKLAFSTICKKTNNDNDTTLAHFYKDTNVRQLKQHT